MEDRLTGRLFSHGEYTEERRGSSLKRINWVLVVLVLIGFVIGRFIGTYFDGTFLNYGQNFGLSSPIDIYHFYSFFLHLKLIYYFLNLLNLFISFYEKLILL
jgi:hypothetical protein